MRNSSRLRTALSSNWIFSFLFIYIFILVYSSCLYSLHSISIERLIDSGGFLFLLSFKRLQAAEREVELTREECARLRGQTERLRGERSALQQRLCEAETSLLEGQEELRRMSDLVKREREQWAIENASGKQLAAELSREVEMLRSMTQRHDNAELTPTAARVHELENEIKTLKQQNNSTVLDYSLFLLDDKMLISFRRTSFNLFLFWYFPTLK